MNANPPTVIDEGRLSEMVSFLESEGQLYQELTELARRKQDVLVQGRLVELEGLLEQEKRALEAVAAVERQRYALQCELARSLGLEPAELTVSRLAALAGPSFGPRLSESQRALVGLIDELSTVNQCNAELIQQSLAYINYAMDLLTGGSAATQYDERGGRRKPGSRLSLFSRHG